VRTYKTEGIILSRKNFSESDKVLTVLTKYHGKIAVLAKGLRKIKSKKAPFLDQLSYSSILLAKGRDLDLVIEASPIKTFSKIKKNLYASVTAFYGAELVNSLTSEKVEGTNIFLLFLDFLREVNKLDDVAKLDKVRFAFTVKLLFALGFWSEKQFKIGVREKGIFSQFLEKSLAEGKELKVENPKKIDLVLRQEVEKIIERRLKSSKIIAGLF